MKIDPIIIAREYYEKVKHLYPELDFKEFAEICYVPWKYTKHNIISGELPTIRLKFFGMFVVYPKKVKYARIDLDNAFDKGLIDEQRHKDLTEIFDKYTENENNETKD